MEYVYFFELNLQLHPLFRNNFIETSLAGKGFKICLGVKLGTNETPKIMTV